MKIVLFSFLALIFLSCQSSPKETHIPTATEKEWSAFQTVFFKDLWTTYPVWASMVGKHEYDGQLKALTPETIAEQVAFLKKYHGELVQFSQKELPPLERMDLELVKNFTESALWDIQVFKSYQWDASNYNVGNAVSAVLDGTSKNEKEKLWAISEMLALTPKYYEVGLKNLTTPTREHAELAIKQNTGLISYFETDLKPRLQKSSLAETDKKIFIERYDQALASVKNYVDQLKQIIKQRERQGGFRSFRIGKKLYAEKFKYDIQASVSASEVYKRAVTMKKNTHQEMAVRAKELWPKYFPNEKPPKAQLVMIKKVLDKLAENHIKPDQFLGTIQQDIPQLWDFIVKKDLLTLDPRKKLKVRETPLYQQGFAGASVDSPGPFDEYRETYYNVTPLTGMTPAQQESYLREYNNYTLHILNIHEALPGHYAQLVYSNKNPSLIKRLFGNGAMVEGWAVYAERMMLEEGYGDKSPELWLMYYKWRLRVICNMILDYGVHNMDMSKKAVMKLIVNEAFQESEEAEKKWDRATYSQVQLTSYFAGFTEIYALREELRLKHQNKFKLKDFHEKFLSYGSAPVKLISAEMLKEAADAKPL